MRNDETYSTGYCDPIKLFIVEDFREMNISYHLVFEDSGLPLQVSSVCVNYALATYIVFFVLLFVIGFSALFS